MSNPLLIAAEAFLAYAHPRTRLHTYDQPFQDFAAAVAAAKREGVSDTERLNWLERGATDGLNAEHKRTVILLYPSLVGENLREAIDAAMAAEAKEKG